MISNRYSRNCRLLLLALPLLMDSLVCYGATDHTFYFGGVSQDNATLYDGKRIPLFTYSTEGDVANLSYSSGNEAETTNGNAGLQFYLGNYSSLTMTTVYDPPSISNINQKIPQGQDNDQFNDKIQNVDKIQNADIIQNAEIWQNVEQPKGFSGTLKRIEVRCPEVYGLVIEAYDGETFLGQLEYSKNMSYDISGLSYLLQSKQISLKFSAPNAPNGASVYELTSVTVSVDESVYPLNMDEPVTFNSVELFYADLSNYTYKGILFTLHTATDGEGFDGESGEGVICMMTPMTDAKVNLVNDAVKTYCYKPGEPGYAVDFSGGITLMVAKGSGKIVLDVELADNYAFHVKVGDAEPVEVSCDSRQEKEVPYTVEENTYVYIYLVQKTSAVRAGTRIGRRATAHGKIYSSKCVGSGSSFVMGDADGNGKVDLDDVEAIANYIMGTPPAGFNMVQADINGDGEVNVVDLVKLVQIIKEHTP